MHWIFNYNTVKVKSNNQQNDLQVKYIHIYIYAFVLTIQTLELIKAFFTSFCWLFSLFS